MTTAVIIIFCALLLIAYLFDLTSSRTKIPSVILLLLLGWIVGQLTDYWAIKLPDFSRILPVLGTLGLILIVLEGSLELELNRSKIGLLKKSFFGAVFSIVVLSGIFTFLFMQFGDFSFRDSLINSIPFSIISSAIAIPSVRNLTSTDKEFVIYESSFSDIFGVLIFNFIALNENVTTYSFGTFGLQLVIITVISFIATIALSFLLSKIEHHIKFVPIILLVILIYSVSKIYHLPALLFILLFGLFIGNLDELKRFKWIEKFKPEQLNLEVRKFKELTIEATFLVRSLFFLLFGYLLESSAILNNETIVLSLLIVISIFIFRGIQMKISKLPEQPLLYVAPRGLITILLFLSIEDVNRIAVVNTSLIVQVILITTLIMMLGLMTYKKKQKS